jgi:hypothetical protein
MDPKQIESILMLIIIVISVLIVIAYWRRS